jgi:hypothetical protein
VPAEEVLSETIVFELPDRLGAERLWNRLRPRWLVDAYDDDVGALVVVGLRSEERDLATLLRTVQLWGFEQGLHVLTFHLDGREYVLESKWIWPAAA